MDTFSPQPSAQPTSVDVARAAGVSQATVSRVLTGHPSVSADTRQRVQQAMAAIGYRPNLAARSMKTSRIDTVGVVVARLSNPIYPELLLHLGSALQTASKQMLVWHAESGGEDAAVAAASHGVVDGVIFSAATSDSVAAVERIASRVPVVLVHRSVRRAKVDQVEVDNRAGGAQVASMFIAARKRRLAIVAGQRNISTVRSREDGFTARVQRVGLPAPLLVRVDHAGYEQGYSAGAEIAAAWPRCDAVFCVNDVIAFGCLDGLRDHGIRCPEDIWVAGFDDVAMARWTSINLTTVAQPLRTMAEEATRLMLQRLEHRGAEMAASPQRVVLRPALIVRRTAGVAA